MKAGPGSLRSFAHPQIAAAYYGGMNLAAFTTVTCDPAIIGSAPMPRATDRAHHLAMVFVGVRCGVARICEPQIRAKIVPAATCEVKTEIWSLEVANSGVGPEVANNVDITGEL